jgi:hypothetical protein
LLRLKSKALTERTLIIYDLGQFERSVMIGMGDRASWSHIVYVLKSMYNPETDTGARDLRNVVMQALADTDLFFGLVSMDVQKRFPRNSYIAEDALAADPYHYQRMVSAAEHYASQLNQHNRGLHNPAVTRFAVALRSFFTPKEGHVKWIESGDNRCMFFNLPLDIAPLVRDAVKQYADKIFVDDCGSREVTAYLQQRLGLDDYGMITARGAANPMEHKVICTISSTHPDDAVVVGLLAQPNLPALVLYENPADIKEFYKKHYGTLKAYAAVFAQDYSGGGNKMFRNFSINPLSIMLASPEYLQKTLSTKLPVKSLIWADFALEHSSQHPYELAVVNSFQQLDINVPMIWGFQLLWAILKACHTQSLERIIFYVSEMDDYQQGQLVDSLRQTPFLDLVLV